MTGAICGLLLCPFCGEESFLLFACDPEPGFACEACIEEEIFIYWGA